MIAYIPPNYLSLPDFFRTKKLSEGAWPLQNRDERHAPEGLQGFGG
jgi:hypothetical protein